MDGLGMGRDSVQQLAASNDDSSINGWMDGWHGLAAIAAAHILTAAACCLLLRLPTHRHTTHPVHHTHEPLRAHNLNSHRAWWGQREGHHGMGMDMGMDGHGLGWAWACQQQQQQSRQSRAEQNRERQAVSLARPPAMHGRRRPSCRLRADWADPPTVRLTRALGWREGC